MSFKNLIDWFFSKGEINRPKKNAIEKFEMSVRATAKCRYNAAIRLSRQGKFAFFTNITLSLGLIFIPLMQNSGISLAFKSNVLNMMSIFLAVSVLVYSVVIGTAKYEVRAEGLTQCGDKLKELNRELNRSITDSQNTDEENKKLLEEFEKRYSAIVTDTENHSRTDYLSAMLEMKRDYTITGLSRFLKKSVIIISGTFPYYIPLLLLSLEVIFISDMLHISCILTDFLNYTHECNPNPIPCPCSH